MTEAKAHNEGTQYKHWSTKKLTSHFYSRTLEVIGGQTSRFHVPSDYLVSTIRAKGIRTELESRGVFVP